MNKRQELYSPPEIKEAKSKEHTISFNDKQFAEEQSPVDTDTLVHKLNKWWDLLCKKESLDPDEETINLIGYLLIEISKNALEYGDGGKIKVIFNNDSITVTVNDNGPGFEDPNEDIELNPGHGLDHIKQFADEFIIESNMRKFQKKAEEDMLITSFDTDKKEGARITFVKRIRK